MKNLLIASLITLVSTNVIAAGANSYAGIEAGYMHVNADNESEGSAVGRLFGGYNINENFALELGVNRMATFQYYGIDVDNWGIDYSLLLRPNISSGLNGLFVRGGGHWSDTSASACGVYCASVSKSGSGFMAGVGYDAKLNESMSARISYTYKDSLSGLEADGHVGSVGILFNF